MKKFAAVIEVFGMMLAFVSMCFDPIEEPLLVMPMLAGLALLSAGIHIEKRWLDEEEIDSLIKHGGISDNTDDDIVWITYDSRGNERYMDSR